MYNVINTNQAVSTTVTAMNSSTSINVGDLPLDANVMYSTTDTPVASVKKRDEYVLQFNALSAKTARATLDMCKVVSDAKLELDSSEFELFCKSIDQKSSDATVRKYLAIGDRYDAFIQYADRLPNSWTSIYLITQIPADKFDDLLSQAKSLKSLTAAQIKSLMGDSPAKKNEQNIEIAFEIYFTREPSVTEWNSTKAVLMSLHSTHPALKYIQVRVSNQFEKRIEKLKCKNEKVAKRERAGQKKAMKLESQKRIDQQNQVYNSNLFDWGTAYDVELGRFVV